MKMRRCLPVLFAMCLSACGRTGQAPKLYNPAAEPLTADELATLLDVQHWKITQTPDDGQPYWGVRLVIANHGSTYLPINPPPPPYRMLREEARLGFDAPVASNGNPQILLGLKVAGNHVTGNITAATPGKGTTTTRFDFDYAWPKDERGGAFNFCSGTVWKDNRVDLIDCRDSNQQPTAALCLEFLHSPPQ